MPSNTQTTLTPAKPNSSSENVLKAAGAMGAATFLSRILGLVREQAFAILFGAGNATDAFIVAFRIPNLLRDLFAEGAMSASLVPTFTRTESEEGQRRAWRVAGLVFRVLFFTALVIAVLGMIFSSQLVELYASAFHAVPGKFELTVRMTRLMFPFFPLVALAAAFMGILNARGKFFVPAFSSALFNLTSIAVGVTCALVLFRWGPGIGIQPIEGMAIGVLAGGITQAFSQLPTLYGTGYRWQPRTGEDPAWHRDPRLRQMLWMMVPGTLGLAATQINILVNTILATSQGPGAVSWLGYAFRLMQFPIGIFGVSLASATLPRISRQWVDHDLGALQATLSQSLRRVLAVNLPASAGLAFLGYPIIQLIFQYGRFSTNDTQATALALAMYAIGLTAYSAVKVLVPACYAVGNTRIPVISSVLAVAVTIILNVLMVKPFGYWGLALGTSIAAILNAAFLLKALQRLIRAGGGDLPIFPLIRSFLEHFAVAMAMGGICFLSYLGLEKLLPDAFFMDQFGSSALPVSRGIKVGFLVSEGVLVVILLSRLLRLKDTTDAVDLFIRKVKNKLRPGRT